MAMQKKPPVVTIMGHVDHGKTTLLDYIRHSRLAAKEVGEITQAIGAYQIEFQGKKVTFIDTPGHAVFTQMRARGAKVADIVILVVAANDGVMPQTKESIRIIKEAGVPFIVAINKIDLPEASVDKVKGQLAENEVFVEGYGGDVVTVPISAKTGQGVDQLLEMIELTAEMATLQADPQASLEAIVIESKLDKFCGPVATLVVQSGTLKRGEEIRAGKVAGKVRMLKDEFGKAVKEALPADPALVLGFSELPPVGEVVVSAKETPEVVEEEKKAALTPEIRAEEGKKLKIILKADVAGSLEAILNCLPAEVEVIDQGVGAITESDVLLAKTLGAQIYGFNLSLSASVKKLAQTEKVRIKTYQIVYDLLKELEERVLKLLEPTIDREILGQAEILATFEMKGEKIAGARVIEGKINKGFPVFIKKGDQVIESKIVSLKQGKQDVNEVSAGEEFGVVLSGKVDFSEGDVISSYSLEEK
jgi:translation initiation factor IF-2